VVNASQSRRCRLGDAPGQAERLDQPPLALLFGLQSPAPVSGLVFDKFWIEARLEPALGRPEPTSQEGL